MDRRSDSPPDRRNAALPQKAAERRHLTIAFCDLSGSTRLAAEMEPELYAELLEELRDMFARIVARHGGEIVRIDGDGAVLLFGLAADQEDPGRRATEAALDLHDAISTLDSHYLGHSIPLRLHSGIHSGIVLLRPGDVVRGKFEMLGDATNIASRLCEVAASDEIIVSQSTLGSDRHFFRTGPLHHIALRGTNRTLPAYAVLGRERTETRFAARIKQGLTPFVGRRRELARLRWVLDMARAGEMRLAMVSGPGGIGKSRLVNEFLEEAEWLGAVIHRAYCEAYLGARPLQPLAQLAASMLAADTESATLPAEAAETLRALVHLAQSPNPRQDAQNLSTEHIAKAFQHGLTHTSVPHLVWIDDWQWADAATRSVIQALLSSADRPLLLLLTSREADALFAELNNAERISLAGLTPDEAMTAISGIGTPMPPFLIDHIRESAGGSPLFIEEYCQSLARGERRLGDGAQDRNAWLDTLIQARFARLPTALADLVKVAAVIGAVFSQQLFETISGLGPDDPRLAQLMTQDFIYPGDVPGTLRFKHGMTRDAIYQIIGLAERRELHARIVAALQQAESGSDEQLEALAYHYAESGNADRAAAYATLAGDRAMAFSALDRAQAQYRAALSALDKIATARPDDPGIAEQRTQILRKFGLACVVDPARDQLPVLEHAVRDAAARSDGKALAWSHYWLGFILYGLGEARASLQHFEAALEAAEAIGEVRLMATIPANLGQAHATACHYQSALGLLDQAIAAMREHPLRPSARLTFAYTQSCRGFVHADQGRFDAAYADFDAAMATLDGDDHEMTASVLTMRSAALLWEGRFDDALHYAEEGLSVAERVKARYLFAMARSLAAYARWRMGGDAAEIDTIESATEWLEASASQQFISLNHGWLAETLVAQGRIEAARRHAALAVQRARKGDRLGEAMAWRAMAEAARASHQPKRAARYLARAERAAEARQSPHEAAKNRRVHASAEALAAIG